MDDYISSYLKDMTATATANSQLLQTMAGASAKVRIHNIRLVQKMSTTVPISEETWVDAGNEPPPGYWRRQEEAAIRRGTLRAQLRWARYRLTSWWPRRRVAHAIAALRGSGEWCERDDG